MHNLSGMLFTRPNTNGGPDVASPGYLHAGPGVNEGRLSDWISSFTSMAFIDFQGRSSDDQGLPVETIVFAGIFVLFVYSTVQFLRPFVALHGHLRRARAIGLPMKVIPFPPGLFSFFAFQVLRRLGLLRPGTNLHKLLSMGRPDGYDLHKEMGDVFVTVSPAGLTLIVADPKVATHVNSKRTEFPKPPNTGAIINIYGRNVINADGDVWRFHRRVTGPVFSERIHRAVWQEGMTQARYMMDSWQSSSDPKSDSVQISSLGDDALRLALNVITGSAYGCPVGWDENPPCAVKTSLSYRASMEQLTAHLMPIFLTPHWLLRFSRRDSTWGRAWEGFTAFGGYMRGMLDRERARLAAGESVEDNLMTVLIQAADQEDEKEERKLTPQEVMGNAFILLFAGHETTANTLHYALLLLAHRPDIQQMLLDEIDAAYAEAAKQGRTELEYELDFNRARWTFAIMSETLRIYTPTGMTNKWTATDQAITFEGRTYVIPEGTRISINGTGIHSNPKVWGENATEWQPSRWIVEGGDGEAPLFTPETSRAPSPQLSHKSTDNYFDKDNASKPPSPTSVHARFAAQQQQSQHLSVPKPSLARNASSTTVIPATSAQGLLKPPKGTFLPFSEGARACSGKKFASVEFVAVLFTLLREHRVELEEGWTAERVRKVLSGRKAGGLTLQPPESIPLKYVKR